MAQKLQQTPTVVFDLDGTLADTSGDLIAAANACFAQSDHTQPLDPIKDQATAFAGGRAMLRLAHSRLNSDWDEATIDADFPRLLKTYGENISVFSTLYDGVLPALETLRAQGYRLAVCTNKPEYLAKALLPKLGLDGYFSAMLGADTLDVRKPHPRHLTETILRAGGTPDKAVLIGDTVTDRDAAKNAGVPCVLVTFGPSGRQVADLNPAALLDHYDDLGTLMANMLPL